MLHTDRFRPSLCVWQVLGITNQLKAAHETHIIHNETPNQDYKARLSLLSRNYPDGDEQRVGGGWRKPLPPHGFGSSISLFSGLCTPELHTWCSYFKKYFVLLSQLREVRSGLWSLLGVPGSITSSSFYGRNSPKVIQLFSSVLP